MESRLKQIKDGNRDTLLENREVALRRFLLLLYARYLCFRVFLECARDTTDGITDDHKLRWLLIQVAPTTLLGSPDIFSRCMRAAGNASVDYLKQLIEDESLEIEKHLPPRTTLFCVLDEAQTLTKNTSFFQSDPDSKSSKPPVPRPILREILLSWKSMFQTLIVSGTGMSMTDVQTVTGSVLAKEGGEPTQTVTEVGGFDDDDTRRAYLERYFPPGFLETPEGKEIVDRVGYWLRGRFVFNAAV